MTPQPIRVKYKPFIEQLQASLKDFEVIATREYHNPISLRQINEELSEEIEERTQIEYNYIAPEIEYLISQCWREHTPYSKLKGAYTHRNPELSDDNSKGKIGGGGNGSKPVPMQNKGLIKSYDVQEHRGGRGGGSSYMPGVQEKVDKYIKYKDEFLKNYVPFFGYQIPDALTGLKRKKEALKRLKDKVGEQLSGLTLENINTATGHEITDRYLDGLRIEIKHKYLMPLVANRNPEIIDCYEIQELYKQAAANLESIFATLPGVIQEIQDNTAQYKNKESALNYLSLQALYDIAIIYKKMVKFIEVELRRVGFVDFYVSADFINYEHKNQYRGIEKYSYLFAVYMAHTLQGITKQVNEWGEYVAEKMINVISLDVAAPPQKTEIDITAAIQQPTEQATMQPPKQAFAFYYYYLIEAQYREPMGHAPGEKGKDQAINVIAAHHGFSDQSFRLVFNKIANHHRDAIDGKPGTIDNLGIAINMLSEYPKAIVLAQNDLKQAEFIRDSKR